jgi:TPR repeat protein
LFPLSPLLGLGITADLILSAEYARLSAEHGNADGQFLYGKKLLAGQGVTQNIADGMKLLRMAADQGNVDAAWTFGHRFMEDPALVEDAIKYLAMAAEHGHREANRDFGRCYLLGIGIAADFASAIRCYTKASDKGDVASRVIVVAYFCCGRLRDLDLEHESEWVNTDLASFDRESPPDWMTVVRKSILTGNGDPDVVFALRELRSRAEDGNRMAQLLCGLCLQPWPDGVRYLSLAADQGDDRAILALLTVYRDVCPHVRFTPFEVAQFCLKVADSSNEQIAIRAMEALSGILTRVSAVRRFLIEGDGFGNSENPITSRFVLRKLGRSIASTNSKWAELVTRAQKFVANRPGAKLWLDGWRCENGCGVELNLIEAACLYRRAAMAGFALGRYHYALFLCHGIGVTKDRRAAVHQLRLAAEQGHADAMFEYGICLEHGIEMGSDIPSAVGFYAKAATSFHLPALRAFGTCLMAGRGVMAMRDAGLEILSLADELSKHFPSSDCSSVRWLIDSQESSRST